MNKVSEQITKQKTNKENDCTKCTAIRTSFDKRLSMLKSTEANFIDRNYKIKHEYPLSLGIQFCKQIDKMVGSKESLNLPQLDAVMTAHSL